MVHVRHVRMLVAQGRVAMPMTVRLPRGVIRSMCMLVALVMDMQMSVIDKLVQVSVFVIFGQVQPDADAHKRARQHELMGQWLAKECDCRERANKRRR